MTPLDYRYDYLAGQLTETAFENIAYEDAFFVYDVILTSITFQQKATAITNVSNIAGVGLSTAKDYVESIMAGTPTAVATVTGHSAAQEMLHDFLDHAFEGKIEKQ